MNTQMPVQCGGSHQQTWTLRLTAETTVVVNLTAFAARIHATLALIHFTASNESVAATYAQVLRGGFSERRIAGKKLSSEAHFQIVEPNAVNDHAEDLDPRSGLSRGENPCFRLIHAEHF